METKKDIGSASTSNLMNRLFQEKNLECFLEKNGLHMKLPSLQEYLQEKCHEKGMIPERIANRGGIESSYCHQIFKGSRKPSRDKVIQLAFGLSLDLNETQKILRIAGHSLLYPRVERDAAVIFCLHRKKSMVETQTLLHELDLQLLGGDRE